MRTLEHKITRVYATAHRDLKKRTREYFEHFDARDTEMKARLAAGEITQAYYNDWRRNQVGRGERWKALRGEMARRLVSVNQIAAAYVNDTTPGIYSLNANYAAYTIEQTGASVSFTLVSEQAVRNLAEGNNQSEFKVSDGHGGYTYRRLQVNPPVDYAWNSQQIERQLTAGILAGDTPKQMADRFMGVMQNNYNAAVRNARTAVTSAQNAGTQCTMEAAQERGISIMKIWMAASDARTRESHREMDGVKVNVDDDFPNGLSYPGDPKGEPGEVYNCRCTLGYLLPGINDSVHNTGNSTETYEQWLNAKQGGNSDGD